MPKFRRLSGPDVIAILNTFGFSVVSQRGSHVKLRRIGPGGARETLHMPLHAELDTGTCGAIYRQACAYIPEDQLRPYFVAD